MAIIEVHGQGGRVLRDAVLNASAGDTIQVWGDPALPYIYVTDNVGVTIVGMNGRENCVIEGGHIYDESTDTHTGQRCVIGFSKNLTTIQSFTLRNGCSGTGRGGGVSNAKVIDCTITNCYANADGGGAYNCSISDSIVEYCTSTGNGGGANNSILTNSIIRNNTSTKANGGGAHGGALTDCEVYGNHAYRGGGYCGFSTTNCVFHHNTVRSYKGSAISADNNSVPKAINCLFYENGEAVDVGSGTIHNYQLYNCTITNNLDNRCYWVEYVAPSFNFIVANCFFDSVYQQASVTNIQFKNCIAIESNIKPENGDVLIVTDPMLTADYHLKKGSPCIGAGNAEYLQSATDLDGKEWKTPPSIGCYEFYGSKKYLPSSLHPLGA